MIDKLEMHSLLQTMERAAEDVLQHDSAFFESLHALKDEIERAPRVQTALHGLQRFGNCIFTSFVPRIYVRVRTENGTLGLAPSLTYPSQSMASDPQFQNLTEELRTAAAEVINSSDYRAELNVVVNEAIKRFKMTPAETRVVVQGSGNVGGIGARLMHEAGYKVVAISDIHGGIYNANGIDITNALQYLSDTRSFEGYQDVEFVNNQELLELPCDVLVPAATENQITSQNADKLQCKVLAEGANGPTTAGADEILHQKGIFVVPDILANAGGVTVSYFEWVQDRMGYFWTETEVNQRLDLIMTESFRDVITYAQNHNVNNRIAAYMLAIDRVAYTTRQRGIYA